MEVKIKDRKEEIEFLRMACNMAELGIGYQHADLIIRLQQRFLWAVGFGLLLMCC